MHQTLAEELCELSQMPCAAQPKRDSLAVFARLSGGAFGRFWEGGSNCKQDKRRCETSFSAELASLRAAASRFPAHWEPDRPCWESMSLDRRRAEGFLSRDT